MLHHLCVSVCAFVSACVRVCLFVVEGQAPQFGRDHCCPVSTSSVHKTPPFTPCSFSLSFSPSFFLLSLELGCNQDCTCQFFRSVKGEVAVVVHVRKSVFVCVGEGDRQRQQAGSLNNKAVGYF